MHIFCNSRLPEKLIAWASGLGGYGKNSLIINKALGSQFVICGLLLDTRATSGIPHPDGIGALCGECNECITACPVGAIGPKAIIDGSKCMQFLATRIVRIPESILGQWGQMIYGCEICQDACPYNRSLSLATLTERGHIGPVVSLDMLLTMTTDEIKAYFKKTALGLSWIDPRAIQRNALIASGNSHNQALLPAVRSFLSVADPQIREVAEWAIQRIQQFSFWTLLPDKSKRNI
jgi:epoxyqueuosine reductase